MEECRHYYSIALPNELCKRTEKFLVKLNGIIVANRYTVLLILFYVFICQFYSFLMLPVLVK